MADEPIPASPRILHLSWGRIEVEGAGGPYKDAKLFPSGSREWDWRETGTRHRPGIQPADVEELLEQGARVVVLSRGFHERLAVCPETLELLESRGVACHLFETGSAAELYERLREKEAVGALLHSTC